MPQPHPLLNLYIIWHPQANSLCQPLAEFLYRALNRDPEKPFSRGMGIPVYFRCVNASGQDRPSTIEWDAAKHSVVILLIDDALVCDRGWADYIKALGAQVQAGGAGRLLVPVALSEAAVNLPADIDETNFVDLSKVAEENLKLRLLHFVAHVLASLLQNTPALESATADARRIQLFISYSRRDPKAQQLVKALKATVDDTQMDRFFDKLNIPSGHDFTRAIKENIEKSVLVAIRSDHYISSPWCRKEVVYAKQKHRPMIVVDALQQQEDRSFPYLSNVPAIRFDPDKDLPATAETGSKLQAIIDFALLEALRFFYLQQHFAHLTTVDVLPGDAVMLSRPPEERDLKKQPAQQIVIYPDPPLGSEEHEELSESDIRLHTPTSYRGFPLQNKGISFAGQRIGVSISAADPGELQTLGLSAAHLQNAMLDIARHLLVKGAQLFYGGDLRDNGFTTHLLELVRYHNDALLKTFLKVQNYLAWPLLLTLNNEWEAKNKAVLDVIKVFLPADLLEAEQAADTLPAGDIKNIRPYVRARCLSKMREQIVENTDARIMLGGKTLGYSGKYPGLVEEALLTLAAKQPLYLLGGYGGAARVIIQALQGGQPPQLTEEYQFSQPGYQDLVDEYNAKIKYVQPAIEPIDYADVAQKFAGYGVAGLNNGLNEKENLVLFNSINHEEAIGLILKGLVSLRAGASASPREV